MSRFKCLPRNLAMGDGVPHGRQWTYISAHPMPEMLGERYFLDQRTMFLPGDTLRVVEMRAEALNTPENRVLSYIDLLVVRADRQGLELRPEHDIVQVPLRTDDPKAAAQWGTERYIGANGDVKWNPGRKHYEVFEGKTVVATTTDKDRAWQIAKGEAPLPETEEAA